MKINDDEAVRACIEFKNYYQITVGPKKREKKPIVGGCRFYAVKKDFSKIFQYYVPFDLDKVKVLFGPYVKELEEDEINEVLEKIK